jgi:hypothetical protein
MTKTGDGCLIRNSLGDCIEWQEIGDRLVPVFKEESKECNAKLYEKWKKVTKEQKIAILPE